MPNFTKQDYENRTLILSRIGVAQQAVDDARWEAVGMHWDQAAKAVRDALVALSEASSLLAAAGATLEPTNDPLPKEIAG